MGRLLTRGSESRLSKMAKKTKTRADEVIHAEEKNKPESLAEDLVHADCQKKAAELTDDLQRLQAEFENYRKRVERDFERIRQGASCDVLRQLLPVLDSFEAALKEERLDKGFRLIYEQLMAALAGQGLRHIECVGLECDPYRHEVLCSEPSDKDGIVLGELQKGYMVNDRVLRHSRVKIGKKEVRNEDKKEDPAQAASETGK